MRIPFNGRAVLAFLHDMLMLAASWFVTFGLFMTPPTVMVEQIPVELISLVAIAMPVQIGVSYFMGMYQGLWRYASLPDIQRIVATVISTALLTALITSFLGPGNPLRFAHFLVQSVLLIGLMSASRIGYRSWKEWRLYGKAGDAGTPVIILGAGDSAVRLLKEITRSPNWHVVGLLDDNRSKHHRVLHGYRVLGLIDQLPEIARPLKLKHAIIAMPSISYPARRRIIEICNRAQVTVLTAPSFNGLALTKGGSEKDAVPKIRPVAVEDLMRREPIMLDDAGLHELLTDKVVLVSGAGGSIGSELCRQIASYRPSLLVLFEQNEFALYNIEQALRDEFSDLSLKGVIGDIKNELRVNQVMHQYSPSLVFHAAAYKHVPMMEEANAWEAVQNNVLGTLVMARAAIEYKVEKFVLISTDKAVNPTNVMGATKRMSEMVCQALQQSGQTRFEMVRFGNVLGSAGSVIPRFQEQIDRGGPVTVTHPDMVRYFMSIPEAAQLVLQAGTMGLGGEIFVLDMGDPVKIVDLASDMIRLSNHSDADIKIAFTGLRPGEKLFEELLADDEHTRPTPHPKLRIAKARMAKSGFLSSIEGWLKQDRIPSDSEVRRDLRRWVPEYVAVPKTKLKAVPPPMEQIGQKTI